MHITIHHDQMATAFAEMNYDDQGEMLYYLVRHLLSPNLTLLHALVVIEIGKRKERGEV